MIKTTYSLLLLFLLNAEVISARSCGDWCGGMGIQQFTTIAEGSGTCHTTCNDCTSRYPSGSWRTACESKTNWYSDAPSGTKKCYQRFGIGKYMVCCCHEKATSVTVQKTTQVSNNINQDNRDQRQIDNRDQSTSYNTEVTHTTNTNIDSNDRTPTVTVVTKGGDVDNEDEASGGGVVIAIVIVIILLLLCCAAAGVAFCMYNKRKADTIVQPVTTIGQSNMKPMRVEQMEGGQGVELTDGRQPQESRDVEAKAVKPNFFYDNVANESVSQSISQSKANTKR